MLASLNDFILFQFNLKMHWGKTILTLSKNVLKGNAKMNDSVTFAYFVKNPFPSLGTSLDICLLSEDFQKLLLWIYCNKWSRPALVSLTSLLRFFLFYLFSWTSWCQALFFLLFFLDVSAALLKQPNLDDFTSQLTGSVLSWFNIRGYGFDSFIKLYTFIG